MFAGKGEYKLVLNSDLKLIIEGEKITVSENVKYFGVIIDHRSNLSGHLDYVCKKIARKLEI